MHIRASAIVCAVRAHGETAVIARLLTAGHGLIAVYVAGGRGRQLRPVLIPGNTVDAEINARSAHQLPWARVELTQSRGPWLAEPLPTAAIGWITTIAACTLPERHPYPAVHEALGAALDAVCFAPAAREWVPPFLSYEILLLRELGYGGGIERPGPQADWAALLDLFDTLGREFGRYPLAERRGDVMAARALLRHRLGRIAG